MKTIILYLLAVCWCCGWFLGCGGSGSADVSVNVSQTQNPGDDPNPCQDCTGTLSQITACLEQAGMVPDDCEGEEEEEG